MLNLLLNFHDDVELEFVDRMAKVETFAEVEVLAKDLAEYCKGESELKSLDDHEFELFLVMMPKIVPMATLMMETTTITATLIRATETAKNLMKILKTNLASQIKKAKKAKNDEDGESDEFENSSGDQSDTVTDEHGSVGPDDWYPSSETDAAWTDNQGHLLDEKSKDNVYYHVHEFKNLNEFVFDYKRVLKDFRDNKLKEFAYRSYRETWPLLVADYKKFQKNQSKAVNYMVKEFELKKAATAHSRSKQDKSGVVDPLKLHSYKYNDDIFKRLTVTPDGKNHGLMMFIDWSGSMSR